MAGNVPDIPAPRIEYDRDGTRVYRITAGGVVTEITNPTTIQQGNNENAGDEIYAATSSTPDWLLFVFPELRDITHMFLDQGYGACNAQIQWSNDSTSGVDGTWTTVTSTWPVPFLTTKPSGYRDRIMPIAGLTGIKMLRIKYIYTSANFPYMTSVHLYGKASAGQTLHRLRFWHPTLDQPLGDTPAFFDWGNAEQGSSATRQFRVKNDSASLTASGITVFMQALTDSAPTQVSQHELSTDGTTWTNAGTAKAIANLGPQQISGVVSLRRSTLMTAQLGLWRQRLVATANTWA